MDIQDKQIFYGLRYILRKKGYTSLKIVEPKNRDPYFDVPFVLEGTINDYELKSHYDEIFKDVDTLFYTVYKKKMTFQMKEIEARHASSHNIYRYSYRAVISLDGEELDKSDVVDFIMPLTDFLCKLESELLEEYKILKKDYEQCACTHCQEIHFGECPKAMFSLSEDEEESLADYPFA